MRGVGCWQNGCKWTDGKTNEKMEKGNLKTWWRKSKRGVCSVLDWTAPSQKGGKACEKRSGAMLLLGVNPVNMQCLAGR